MDFRVARDVLADAVGWTARSLPQRPTVPVLAGLLLRVEGGELTVAGFDYEVSGEATIDVSAGADGTADGAADGAALVPGRLLADIARALPDRPVHVCAAGRDPATAVELTCGSARFTLPTLPLSDYPALPEMPPVAGTVDAAAFAAGVAQVAVAAGRDDTLPALTGVRIELAGTTMTMIATDRYRMAMRELPWQPAGDPADGDPADGDAADPLEALVPARSLADTARALGSATGSATGGQVAVAVRRGTPGGEHGGERGGDGLVGFAGHRRRTTGRLLDAGSYPAVRSLFAAEPTAEARLPTALLAEVVRRVALVAERASPVRLTFDETGLIVEAGGGQQAQASEAVAAAYAGYPLTVGVNPQYLLDAVAALGAPTAVLSFVGPLKPMALSAATAAGEPVPGYRHLIQPIRLPR
jgi:DNA polymerase III subunit beta